MRRNRINDITVMVELPPGLLEQVDEAAFERGWTRDGMIEVAVASFLFHAAVADWREAQEKQGREE